MKCGSEINFFAKMFVVLLKTDFAWNLWAIELSEQWKKIKIQRDNDWSSWNFFMSILTGHMLNNLVLVGGLRPHPKTLPIQTSLKSDLPPTATDYYLPLSISPDSVPGSLYQPEIPKNQGWGCEPNEFRIFLI